MTTKLSRISSAAGIAAAVAFIWAAPTDARVTKIVIDQKVSPAFCTGTPPVCPSFGDAGQYETLTGRAFGELDPHDSQNEEITDLKKAKRNAKGKVEYVATFHIVKPINMNNSSGLMWHDVPNRGGRINISTDLRTQGDIGLSSAWQGDNAGATAVPADAWSPHADPGRQQRMGRGAGDHRHDRQDLRPHHQPHRAQRGAAERDGQSDSVLPGEHDRQHGRGAHDPHQGDDQRQVHRGRNGAEQRLEVLRRRHVRRADAGDHAAGAALSQGRVRPDQALPARLHGEGSVRARRRHRGVPRPGIVLPLREGEPGQSARWRGRAGRSSAARRSRATSRATSSISA